MGERKPPNLVAWEAEVAVQRLEAEGWTVRVVVTKPPQGRAGALRRVVRQKVIGERLVELVVAGMIPEGNADIMSELKE